MKSLVYSLLTISLFLGTSAQAEVNSGIGVMGFSAWKSGRVDEAKALLEKLQSEPASVVKAEVKATKAPQETSRVQKAGRGDQKLQQAQLSLEIVQELSVNDYFVLYLNQFKDRSAFIEAARKLSADEAADLMIAYQKHLALGSPESDTAVPSRN